MNRTKEALQIATNFMKDIEGYHKKLPDGRCEAYPDPIHGWKVPTIGFGTTVFPSGAPVKRGDVITRQEAEASLRHHLEEKVLPHLRSITHWDCMSANQRAALMSFGYNLGVFYKRKNRESITRVCDSPEKWDDAEWITEQFVKYRNPGTAAENGLRRRRIAEAQMFLK